MAEYKYVKELVPTEEFVKRVYKSGSPQHLLAVCREFLQDAFGVSTRSYFREEFGKGLLTPFRLLSNSQYFFDNYSPRDISITMRIGEQYQKRADAADVAYSRFCGFTYGGIASFIAVGSVLLSTDREISEYIIDFLRFANTADAICYIYTSLRNP